MARKSFDTEQLNLLPVESVLSALGIENTGNRYYCPHDHKKKQQLTIKNNMCKCYNCQTFPRDDQKFGGPISVVQYISNCDFVEACTWLHETYGVPYLDGTQAEQRAKHIPKLKKKEIEYLTFDYDKECADVSVKKYLKDYASFSDEQKLKLVYTFFYRYSKRTKDVAKDKYYAIDRGIHKDNVYTQAIGYLSMNDIKDLIEKMRKIFPEEDLLRFKILKKHDDGNITFKFSFIKSGGLLVVPSFDLYNNMATGFMLRPTHPEDWMKKQGLKELQLSAPDIVPPLPFGITCQALRDHHEFYFCEGHVDLASIPDNQKTLTRAGIASPGTHGIREHMLGLFRGKKAILVYDQDFSGQKAELGYTAVTYETNKKHTYAFLDTKDGREKLKKKIQQLSKNDTKFTKIFHMGMKQKLTLAGIKDIETLKWNTSWGGDINDLMINGNLFEVFPKENR